jgi:thymidylate synthase ThyX
VAQLGGVHLACEQSSNVLSKVLEWGRLMSYLEQSTRYIAYDNRLESGHYRYFRPTEILDSPYGARYVGDMDRVFDTYGELLPAHAGLGGRALPPTSRRHRLRLPPGGQGQVARRPARPAPRASLSNIGLYGTGQSYEQLLLRMRPTRCPRRAPTPT